METKGNNQSVNLNWLWGSILIVLGGIALLGQFVPGFSVGPLVAVFFVGGGAVFFTIYLRDHEHWWALIPGYTLMMIGAVIFFGTMRFPGNFIGMFIMFAIAFPFLYVYIRNRENWWALIPAYTMSSIGGIIALSSVLHGNLMGTYVMFTIALPFFYVYLRNREHWWALIPAGIMGLIGIGLLLGTSYQFVVPAALILLGIFLLGRQVIHDKSEGAPATGPDADRPPSV